MADFSKSALVILGHGSTENPDSSAPTLEQAEVIRRRGIFAEVHSAFWKEEPSYRQLWHMIDAEEIYIVPNFISEGYFTREVLPRELGIETRTSQVHGKTVHYCDPVGIHASMTGLLRKRANEVMMGEVEPAETSLFIVGHGTGLNKNSTAAVRDQADRIREDADAGFAEVYDAYMEEAPFIADWDKMSTAKNVVVVPFFIADALHSYQDIPVLLGIEKEITAAASQRDVFRQNPYRLRDKTLYYSSAIGTDASMAEIILDQVHDFGKNFSGNEPINPE